MSVRVLELPPELVDVLSESGGLQPLLGDRRQVLERRDHLDDDGLVRNLETGQSIIRGIEEKKEEQRKNWSLAPKLSLCYTSSPNDNDRLQQLQI